jgi:hypothetical protein
MMNAKKADPKVVKLIQKIPLIKFLLQVSKWLKQKEIVIQALRSDF